MYGGIKDQLGVYAHLGAALERPVDGPLVLQVRADGVRLSSVHPFLALGVPAQLPARQDPRRAREQDHGLRHQVPPACAEARMSPALVYSEGRQRVNCHTKG